MLGEFYCHKAYAGLKLDNRLLDGLRLADFRLRLLPNGHGKVVVVAALRQVHCAHQQCVIYIIGINKFSHTNKYTKDTIFLAILALIPRRFGAIFGQVRLEAAEATSAASGVHAVRIPGALSRQVPTFFAHETRGERKWCVCTTILWTGLKRVRGGAARIAACRRLGDRARLSARLRTVAHRVAHAAAIKTRLFPVAFALSRFYMKISLHY